MANTHTHSVLDRHVVYLDMLCQNSRSGKCLKNVNVKETLRKQDTNDDFLVVPS